MNKAFALVSAVAVAVVSHGPAIGLLATPAPQHVNPPITVSPTTVSLSAPAANAKFLQGDRVSLTANVTVRSGSEAVSQVDFYSDGVLLGTARTLPYTVVWTAGAPKAYALTAVGRSLRGTAFSSPAVPVTVVAPAMPPLPAQPLLQQSQLVYQGAFQLPPNDGKGGSFRYGGKGLAFNRARGTLFVGGEELYMKVGELTVPEVRNGASVSALATAQIVQALADPSDGKYSLVASADYVRQGGILPYKGKLYASAYHYYDANGLQATSHFASGTDLSVTTDVKGPVKVGTLKTGYTSGYMGEIPAEWQAALGGPALVGNCCISIISRTSYGPGAFSFNPEDIGTKDPVPATPLVYYPDTNPLAAWDATSLLFNGTTQITGVVFPEGRGRAACCSSGATASAPSATASSATIRSDRGRGITPGRTSTACGRTMPRNWRR
jgi:hypothetical protein